MFPRDLYAFSVDFTGFYTGRVADIKLFTGKLFM